MSAHARLRPGLSAVGAIVSAFIGILFLGTGLRFDAFYYSGLPVWLHTVVAFSALAPGLLLLLRAIRRLPRRLAFLWHQRRGLLLIPIAVAVGVAMATQLGRAWRPLPDVPGASRAAVAYLLNGLSLMESRYLHSDRIEWPSIRSAALAKITNAQSPSDTYPAIRQALAQIQDRHSFLLEPRRRAQATRTGGVPQGGASRSVLPFGRLTADRLAYVSVPWQIGSGWGSLYFLNDPGGRAYARRLRTLLHGLDARRPLGWVIDLRANAGGNMWPMLDGLGPLLGEGRISSILMPQFGRRVDTWIVAGRASSGPPWFGGLGLVGPEALRLQTASSPVAVLIGTHTASAGEAVAVAFRGRPNTHFVGVPTAGLATATMPFSLPDGAELVLTIGYLADRAGRRYEGPIQPDQQVPSTDGRDEALLVAARWIRDRHAHAWAMSPQEVATPVSPPAS